MAKARTMRVGRRRGRGRGTIYVLTISLATLVSVAAVGALLAARVQLRTGNDASDWEEAGVLAFSAVEQGICAINTAAAAAPSSWRAAYISGRSAYTTTMGRGTLSWMV